MAEEYNLNKILGLENTAKIKAEVTDDSCSVDVYETSISANEIELKDDVWDDRTKEYKVSNTVDDIKIELSLSEACNIVLNDDVKIENEISPEIKVEFENKLLFCDHCEEHYEDYCTKCGMLVHILNGITRSITNDRVTNGIPNDVLEIRESSGRVGVFALKVIPENVKVGPFNGLSTSECSRRLKGGKFVVGEDKLKSLNWMQYINPARNIFQQNLIPFQRQDNLYYQCNREILEGEELLVYFGEEYEDSVNKDIETAFVAPTENDVRDVFACAPCCLGFSSRGYLAKHKSTCPNETDRRYSVDELTQCPFCNIYFYAKEYLESHMPYCCERNVRKCIPMTLDSQTAKVSRRKTKRPQPYKCTQCKYKTTYKSVLRTHLHTHYEVKLHRCEICSKHFKTKGSLKLHVKYRHIDVEAKEDRKLSMRDYMKANTKAKSSVVYSYSKDKTKCKFQTKYKYNLEAHIKTKHLKQFSYECEVCDYKTNHKQALEIHVKTKHLKQFNYSCEICDYKSNKKSNLEIHVKTRHLKQFSYACEICDYKTNHEPNLKLHVKTKHLKQFSYECEICDYKTNHESALKIHVKTKHLKQFSYECEICDFKTNGKQHLEIHVKTKHLKQFSYECEICDYKTNHKSYLKIHVKTKHLKQFSFECEICDFKTNKKQHLEIHVKTKHLKQFSYECEICNYKTNNKSNLETHTKTKHLKC